MSMSQIAKLRNACYGEAWQFLRLKAQVAGFDRRRYYIDNVGGILAVFQRIIATAPVAA